MKLENLCINCMRERAKADGTCEFCGFSAQDAQIPPHHLPPYTILAGKYLVGKARGEGGFGITYIGMDLTLEMRVAIKEYYPNGCVVRDRTDSISVQSYSNSMGEFFERGRDKFINEAKVLAKCNEFQEIVSVKEFFRENRTAYIVMEYIDGQDLRSYLKEHGGKLSVKETLDMMKPVIRSMAKVHELNLIHRDISPDNIMITKTGRVKVLDFGGARDYISAGNRSMSIMLKPGYAPEEQYYSHGEQGPWTDVYALCATIYRCITGEIPPESLSRMRQGQDTLKPLHTFQLTVPVNVENALMRGLSVYKDDRIQTMQELYDALFVQKSVSIPSDSSDRRGVTGSRQGNYGADGQKIVYGTENTGGDRQGGSSGGRQGGYVGGNTRKNDDGINKILKLAIILCVVVLVALSAVLIVFPAVREKTDSGSSEAETQTEMETQPPVVLIDEAQLQQIQAQETQPPQTETLATEKTPSVYLIDMPYVSALLDSWNTGANFSMYVYDLQENMGTGTDNCENSLPASALISLPILYTVGNCIEQGYLSMSDMYTFEYTYQNGRGTLTADRNGGSVSIEELVTSMLMYSDNNAINTLIGVLGLDAINNTCHEAGFSSVDLQRKIISGNSSLNNYISAKDMAMITKELYNNRFSVINRDFVRSYVRISDKSGREGIFRSDELYNNGSFCSQNGMLPYSSNGRYNEMGIIFAGGKEYIITAMANEGDATRSPGAISEAASYIHNCMISAG